MPYLLLRMNIPFKQSISKLNFISSFVIIIVLTVCFAIVFSIAHYKDYAFHIEDLELQVYESKKGFLKNAVDRTIADIELERQLCSTKTADSTLSLSATECSETRIQERIKHRIRSTALVDDGYIWINEVLDYAGGDNYAVRLVHPNLIQTEGKLLSTSMTDIKGNTPYLAELEGIKKEGEIFFEYWFKKKGSDKIEKKLSYAKLYKPYDWIIGTGAYIDDIEPAIIERHNRVRETFQRRLINMVLLGLAAAVTAFLIARFYHKRIKTTISGFVKEVEDHQATIETLNKTLEDRVEERTHQIKLSEQRYERLFQNAPVPLWEEDFTPLIKHFNQLKENGVEDFRAYFDLNPEEVAYCAQLIQIIDVNKETILLHDAKDKADLMGNLDKLFTEKSLGAFKEELIAIAQGATTFEVEGEVRTLNDDLRCVSLRLFLDQDQTIKNNAIALLATPDITAIREAESALENSEERFRTLYEKAPLSYQSLDKEGNFIEVNKTWLQVMGYTRNEVIGKNFSEFLHPDWRDHFKENFPKFKAVGEILGVEFEMTKKNGDYILVSFHGKIAKDKNDDFKQTHCIFRDITQEKQLLKDKEALESQLRQAQKMEAIGNLAGGIAHDFNNMLFPLLGYAEMLKEDLPKDHPLQDNVNEILQASLRARNLVKQILTFSRQNEHEYKAVELQAVITEIIPLLKSNIPDTIHIRTDIDQDCETIMADPAQMHQVIMNIITNAYHAMQDTGGDLNIILKQVQIDSKPIGVEKFALGRYALIEISDTGTGMGQEVLDKVFDPYFTTKETGKGTGLGLSVVQGIVKACKGDIRIHSEKGKGTVVQVYLPTFESALEKKKITPVATPANGGETILVVDDDPAIVQMVGEMITRLGYHVAPYTDPSEALAHFSENPDRFDVIISDMTMPEMSGIQLSEKMKAVRQDIPFIICTGFSDQIDDASRAQYDIQGYIEKPVIKMEMAKKIRSVLQH